MIFSILTNSLYIIFGIAMMLLSRPQRYSDHYIHHNANELIAEAEVISEPVIGKNVRLILNIKKNIIDEKNYTQGTGDIIAYFQIDSLSTQLRSGDLLLIHAPYYALQSNQNPLAFDYKSYLYYQGIEHQTFVKEYQWQYLGRKSGWSLPLIAQNLRQSCLSIFEKHIHDPDNLAILSAMILGLRNNLSEEIYQAYTDTGAVHILAVSGMHVGIVNSIFLLLFIVLIPKKYVLLKKISVIFTIVLIWLFAFITGAAPAVLRAATMFSLLSFGLVFDRKKSTYNILGSSAILLLCIDPHLLFSGSFQFSYLALLSILYFHPLLSKMFYVRNKFIQFFINLILVAVSAQMLVFPITIYYFHKFASSFFISGIVAIIMAYGIIFGGIALLFFEYISTIINPLSIVTQWVATLLDMLLYAFIQSIKWIQQLPFSNIDQINFDIVEVFLMYLILGAIIFWISFQYRKSVYVLLTICIIWVMFNVRQTIQAQSQQFFICYDVQKSMAIDFVNGQQLYSYSDSNGNNKILRFARDNFRLSLKLLHITNIDSMDIDKIDIIKDKSLIQFLDKTIVLAHGDNDLWQHIDTMDYLIVGDVNTYRFSDKIKNKSIKHIIVNHYMNNFKTSKLLDELKSWHPHVSYVGESAVVVNY